MFTSGGRRKDLVWLHFDEVKNNQRKGCRAKCKKCKKEMEGQVARMKKHVEISMLNINMEASRQNFLLGSPPLAALHSMADMKPNGMASPYPSSQTLKQSPTCSSGTPHGINDILGRPIAATGPSLGTTLGALPRLGLGMTAAGMYFGGPKLGLGDLPGRPHIYWPNVLQSQALWRDRFASAAGKSYPFHIRILSHLMVLGNQSNFMCKFNISANNCFVYNRLLENLLFTRLLLRRTD